MDIFTDSIRDLPALDKLLLVERIWDDLASANEPLPLPSWGLSEAARRRDEMLADPNLGKTHEQIWDRINGWRNA